MTAPRRRARLSQSPASWVQAFVEDGVIPDRGTPDYHAFMGWQFFGESVEGLPNETTTEARELIERAYSEVAA
jgi:hypothetical protein